MSEVTVEHTESLSREQAAVWLHALSEAIRKGGKVTLPLGSAEGTESTVSLRFPEHMQAEFEVEVDGDEVQVEVELAWSTAQAEVGDGGSDES